MMTKDILVIHYGGFATYLESVGVGLTKGQRLSRLVTCENPYIFTEACIDTHSVETMTSCPRQLEMQRAIRVIWISM